jgi:hypothetical protein
MLSNLSQYSPQGLMPQFPGLQAAGFPQMSQGLFGQPGAYNGYGPSGQESVPAALSQQFPFGGPMNPFLQNPPSQTQFSQSPFAPNPYLQSPWAQGYVGHNPPQNSFGGQAGANIPAQHIVPVLGQLAQQLAVQSAVTQQIGIAVHQLAQHLAQQGIQGYPGGGFGTGQGLGGQAFGQGLGGQSFGPQGLANQGFGGQFGGYGGFGPQAQGWGGNQAWGGNRSQTIQ